MVLYAGLEEGSGMASDTEVICRGPHIELSACVLVAPQALLSSSGLLQWYITRHNLMSHELDGK